MLIKEKYKFNINLIFIVYHGSCYKIFIGVCYAMF